MTNIQSIALDGHCGAGKSTVAKLVAQKTGLLALDTGAMYRATALYMLKNGVDVKDAEAVAARANEPQISVKNIQGVQHTYLNGSDVSADIRREEVSRAASLVATVKAVRVNMVGLQRQIAESVGVIMDGRDIGTVVLPNAALKVFLTADPKERARRRYEEIKNAQDTSYEKVLEDILKRDYNDEHRAESPLKMAEDACLVDSTHITARQAADKIIELFNKKTKKQEGIK